MDASILQDISIEELLIVMTWRRLNQDSKEYIAQTLLLIQDFEEKRAADNSKKGAAGYGKS